MVLAVFVMVAAMAGQQSLLRQVFPQPDGSNGYEDYLRAADLVNDGCADLFVIGAPTPEPMSEATRRAREKLSAALRTTDPLGIEEAGEQRYRRAFELIASGNAKKAFDPRDPAQTRRYPELRPFLNIAYLMAMRSYCQEARGENAAALQTLLDGLTFVRRFAAGSVIAQRYSDVARAALLARLDQSLPAISLREARTLASFSTARLSEASGLLGIVDAVSRARDALLDEAARPGWAADAADELRSDVGARLRSARPEELRALVDGLRRLNRDAFRLVRSDLALDESRWYEASARWNDPASGGAVGPNASMVELAEAIHHETGPRLRPLVLSEMCARAQLRLLGLHAAVVDYRWRNHRLPRKLADCTTASSTVDPLSGEQFVYELRADGGYRLYSKGRPETGVVDLRHEPPMPIGRADP